MPVAQRICLGMGYAVLGPGQIEPNRVHGAFIVREVNRVWWWMARASAPNYIDNMFDNLSQAQRQTVAMLVGQ